MKKQNARKQLAKNVKKYRIEIGFTQDRVAEIANIEYKYFQSIAGRNPPNITLETLNKLSKALKASPAELLKED